MARKLIQKLLPDPSVIRENKSLQFLGEHLLDPNLWHLNRRSAALAFFIGVFVCFIPMPFQMVLAAFLALLVRCNLPLSIALVWISNPVTMPVMFYFTYKVGCYILQTPVSSQEFHMSLQWLHHEIGRIWLPLYVGSLSTGLVVAALSYFGIRVFWRWHIIRAWKQRRSKRRFAPKS